MQTKKTTKACMETEHQLSHSLNEQNFDHIQLNVCEAFVIGAWSVKLFNILTTY